MFPLMTMSDQERHDYILQHYVLNKATSTAKRRVHDIDVIKEHHRFLWDNADDTEAADSWEVRLARRYYDKLFKEYCIADLTCYKQNKVALRWRTEAEVVTGKGQFQCGSRKCECREGLRSWEVNFAYQEHGVRKNALVKLRLCGEHSAQLNYTSHKREVKRLKRTERLQAKGKKLHKRRKGAINSEQELENAVDSSTEKAECSRVQQHDGKTTENSVSEAPEPALHQTEVEDVWSRKPEMELEQSSREVDFERYLEDLLL